MGQPFGPRLQPTGLGRWPNWPDRPSGAGARRKPGVVTARGAAVVARVARAHRRPRCGGGMSTSGRWGARLIWLGGAGLT
jgi:hypothetical protein